MSPTPVSSTESLRSPEAINFAVIAPAPVSTWAEGTPQSSILPPPLSALTGPVEDAIFKPPPPVSICTGPLIFPKSMLPPPVETFRFPVHLST